MNVKKIFKHIVEVAISNVTTILSGIVVGFLLPKIITVEDYGYYKTFTLYVTYLGLFSLGLIDGIVLKYGGYDYERIDKPLFRCYFRWYILIHLFFSSILLSLCFLFSNSTHRFICLALGVDLLAVNISGYFQNISQITQRFKEYSFRKILQSVFNIVAVGIMYLSYTNQGELSFKVYVAAVLLINSLLTFWYIYTYRDLIIGKYIPLKGQSSEIFKLIKAGFPLLFANMCSTLILTLDRQFVNFLFDTKTYGIYAFAYSMLALVTVATSAIATVLYPALKRTSEKTMRDTFPMLVMILMIVVFALMSIYFPLKGFIIWFLPKYTESLIIFRVIFPGLGISSVITVIMHNYYKAMGVNLEYFKRSLITIIISAIGNLIAYLLFHNTIAISIASIITMVIWYLYIESYFRKKYDYSGKKNFLYLLGMMIVFYSSSILSNNILGFLIYVILFCTLSFGFYSKNLKEIIMKFNKEEIK